VSHQLLDVLLSYVSVFPNIQFLKVFLIITFNIVDSSSDEAEFIVKYHYYVFGWSKVNLMKKKHILEIFSLVSRICLHVSFREQCTVSVFDEHGQGFKSKYMAKQVFDLAVILTKEIALDSFPEMCTTCIAIV